MMFINKKVFINAIVKLNLFGTLLNENSHKKRSMPLLSVDEIK
jgi:hypothetical protein